MAGPYKLKLKKLDFLSAVDSPAQGDGARALLFKRKHGKVLKLRAKVAKTDDSLGLVFGYAFSSSLNGGATPHIDFQDDAIDEDFLKAAMDFVEGGGATDVNHDGDQDGRVIFAWPLLPEINKALGIEAKTVGLAVAIKPSSETYKRFKSGELTGFSIAGYGERETLKAKKRVAKRGDDVVFTDLVDGHQHAVDLDDPACGWMDVLSTSYQTSGGAATGHSHSWTYDATSGAITIGADSGHTHTVGALIPPEVLAAAAAMEAAEDARLAAVPAEIAADPSDGIPAAIPVEESSGVIVNVNIAARNSTRSEAASKPGLVSKENIAMADAKDTEIADLKKRLASAERFAKMTDAHKAHHGTLSTEDAEAFLAKSASERDAVLAEIEKADGEVYKAADGMIYRKSDDPRLVAMAKARDEDRAMIAKATLEAEQSRLEKRAGADLSHFGKSLPARCALLKAIDGIVDEKVRAEVVEAVKSANVAMAELAKAKGYTPEGGPEGNPNDTPIAKFNVELAEFAKTKNKTPAAATAEFVATPLGAALYTDVETVRLATHRR